MASDFHSHTRKSNAVTLLSVPYPGIGEAWPWSLEYHPWNLPSNFNVNLPENFLGLLEQAAALGEIGLDKLRGPEIEIQCRWLKLLLEAAQELQKPVVFHCVKMVPELLALTKKYKFKKLFHGFRGSPELLEELRKHEFYISLAPAALKRTDLMAHLRTRGLNRIGLETDTAPETIEAIIETAAPKLNLTYTQLEEITDQTFGDFLADARV